MDLKIMIHWHDCAVSSAECIDVNVHVHVYVVVGKVQARQDFVF